MPPSLSISLPLPPSLSLSLSHSLSLSLSRSLSLSLSGCLARTVGPPASSAARSGAPPGRRSGAHLQQIHAARVVARQDLPTVAVGVCRPVEARDLEPRHELQDRVPRGDPPNLRAREGPVPPNALPPPTHVPTGAALPHGGPQSVWPTSGKMNTAARRHAAPARPPLRPCDGTVARARSVVTAEAQPNDAISAVPYGPRSLLECLVHASQAPLTVPPAGALGWWPMEPRQRPVRGPPTRLPIPRSPPGGPLQTYPHFYASRTRPNPLPAKNGNTSARRNLQFRSVGQPSPVPFRHHLGTPRGPPRLDRTDWARLRGGPPARRCSPPAGHYCGPPPHRHMRVLAHARPPQSPRPRDPPRGHTCRSVSQAAARCEDPWEKLTCLGTPSV